MLVKVNTLITNLNGETMKEDDGRGNAIDATVKQAMVNAVLAPKQNDNGVKKIEKYELAKKIHTNDEVDLNEKEITLIKECIGEVYAPIIVGQIYELLKV